MMAIVSHPQRVNINLQNIRIEQDLWKHYNTIILRSDILKTIFFNEFDK